MFARQWSGVYAVHSAERKKQKEKRQNKRNYLVHFSKKGKKTEIFKASRHPGETPKYTGPTFNTKREYVTYCLNQNNNNLSTEFTSITPGLTPDSGLYDRSLPEDTSRPSGVQGKEGAGEPSQQIQRKDRSGQSASGLQIPDGSESEASHDDITDDIIELSAALDVHTIHETIVEEEEEDPPRYQHRPHSSAGFDRSTTESHRNRSRSITPKKVHYPLTQSIMSRRHSTAAGGWSVLRRAHSTLGAGYNFTQETRSRKISVPAKPRLITVYRGLNKIVFKTHKEFKKV